MSTALLSICLWIGASPVALLQEETPKPSPTVSPEAVTPPPLQLSPSTMDEYHLAMHLIDVRGKNEEGAEKLLALVDLPDVIAYPGQAPWLLTQAARALTLAGKSEEAQNLMPGIRNGSRGTAFEDSIRAQLSAFGPKQYGINRAFLKYVLSHWKEEGDTIWAEQVPEWVGLKREYGRALLPYLQYIIEDVNQEYGIQKRSFNIRDLVEMLDADSARWLIDYLTSQEEIEKAILMRGLNPGSGRSRRSFMDQLAQVEMATFILKLQSSGDNGDPKDRLQALLNYLSWGRPLHEDKDSEEWQELASIASELAAGLPLESESLGPLDVIAGLYMKNPLRYEQILLASANGSAGNLQRWFLANPPSFNRLLREWSLNGTDADRIRYTCMNPFLWNGTLSGNAIPHLEMENWRRSFLDFGKPPYISWGNMSAEDIEPADVEALMACRESSHPLVRFQAASCLLAFGEAEKAFSFLEKIGPDPTWARYLLNSGSGPNSEQALKNLLPFALEGPLQSEAKDYIRRYVSPWFSMEWWKALDIPWSNEDATQLLFKLRKEKDAESIQWVVEHPHPEQEVQRVAFQCYSFLDPLDAIALLESSDFYTDDFYNLIGIEEWTAAKKESNDENYFQNNQFRLVDFLKSSRDNDKVAFAMAIMKYEPNFTFSILPSLDFSAQSLTNLLVGREFQEGLARTTDGDNRLQLLKFLLESADIGHASTFEPALNLCVFNGVPNEEAFALAWNYSARNVHLRRAAIQFLAPFPELRKMIANEIPVLLEDGNYADAVCRSFIDAGAVQEIFPILQSLIEKNPGSQSLGDWLSALREVDNPESVGLLLSFVEDTRKNIRSAAASSLGQISANRASKAKWAAWGEDQEETTVLMALLKDLEDPEMEVRLGAVKALGLLGDPEALPVLVDLLREDEPIKQAAKEALDRMGTAKKD